ncbi:MAG: CRISPR-associated endonuclease Cas2 [Clostridia bacterium]
MRIIIFFDLPTETIKQQRDYRKFRKLLINQGFIMMQESVYSKLALNMSAIISIKEKIEKNKPDDGLIQSLVITEKQFASIDTIIGKNVSEKINNTDRMVII